MSDTAEYAETKACNKCGRMVFVCMLGGQDDGKGALCPVCRREPRTVTVGRVSDAIVGLMRRCVCPGCKAMIPRWWYSGMCGKCACEDCEHEDVK